MRQAAASCGEDANTEASEEFPAPAESRAKLRAELRADESRGARLDERGILESETFGGTGGG